MDAQPGSAARQFPTPPAGADVPGFVRALREAKLWAGDPSLGELRRHTRIATSTLSDALSPQGRTARSEHRLARAHLQAALPLAQEQQLPELPVITGLLAELPSA